MQLFQSYNHPSVAKAIVKYIWFANPYSSIKSYTKTKRQRLRSNILLDMLYVDQVRGTQVQINTCLWFDKFSFVSYWWSTSLRCIIV